MLAWKYWKLKSATFSRILEILENWFFRFSPILEILEIWFFQFSHILEILEIWFLLIFWIFTKKTRAEISRRMHRSMGRDLSYETNSGPKTKTVETWDLAYSVFIFIFYYSSASVIFLLSWYFINLVDPVAPGRGPDRSYFLFDILDLGCVEIVDMTM